jgi:hypothetical protein
MRTPIHVWLVGVLSLLWNGGGAYDYLMMQTKNAGYLEMLSDAQMAFMQGVPMWFDIGWAFGVWGSILGSILILLRSRFALHAFGLSLLGMLTTSVYSLLIASPGMMDIAGSGALMFSLLIVFVLLVLIVYTRLMARRGVLR